MSKYENWFARNPMLDLSRSMKDISRDRGWVSFKWEFERGLGGVGGGGVPWVSSVDSVPPAAAPATTPRSRARAAAANNISLRRAAQRSIRPRPTCAYAALAFTTATQDRYVTLLNLRETSFSFTCPSLCFVPCVRKKLKIKSKGTKIKYVVVWN